MLQKYSHTSFTVSDLEKSLDFYVKALGMKLGRRWERVGLEIGRFVGVPGARLKMASVTLEDFTLELIQDVTSSGTRLDPSPNNVGAAHIGFTVTNLDQTCEQLKRKGVRFRGKITQLPDRPRELPGPGPRGLYLADPDGITIELVEVAS